MCDNLSLPYSFSQPLDWFGIDYLRRQRVLWESMCTCVIIIKKTPKYKLSQTHSTFQITYILVLLKQSSLELFFTPSAAGFVLPVRTSVESLLLWNLETPDTCCCCCRRCVITRCVDQAEVEWTERCHGSGRAESCDFMHQWPMKCCITPTW